MKSLLVTVLAGLMALAVTAAAEAQVKVRVGGTGTPDGPDTKAMMVFRDRLQSTLGKDVSVDLFPASQLGTWSEMVEQVKGGVLECIYESVGDLGDYHPAANIEGVAYLYKDEEAFFKVWRGPVGQEILDTIAKEAGFRVVGPAFRGFRQFLLQRPVDTLAQLRGIKVRVPGIPAYIESVRALGASPTTVAFEESYTAIQQGVVDGLEQSLIAIKDQRFYEVAKQLVKTDHIAETMGFICGEPWYRKLDNKTRVAIDSAAVASADWYRGYARDSGARIMAELKGDGVALHEPDLAEFRKRAATAMYDPRLQPVIDKIRAAQ